jgi:ABC-type multidrug transport system ATPase subunit
MDILRPASGTASLLGMDAQRDSVASKRKVAYVAGEPSARGGVGAKPRPRLHNDDHGEAGPT